ncbi:MAG: alanine--tRNA ligase [Candidatus Micrarchaeota archaeon]|nr:alanine--tRNA ligase [Candidatus Micrarchaeota archaeon]
MLTKEYLYEMFQRDWEKNYKLNVLIDHGFKRKKCKSCKRPFWTLVEEREYCEDASCTGYTFIGNSPAKKKLDYVETWKLIEKYFVDNGHTSIKPFPTVARWRDDLYFNIASICNFQPYVVNGELEPVANPLIVPQTSIRFGDISNVGVTGRHYTNFVMIGQHAFNNEKTGLFYWKEEAIYHDINYLKALGLPLEEITFKEDFWLGGGNFGPSLEYFCRGLELGNCVFQEFKILNDNNSYEPLKLKVIDMGAGLARLCWITNPIATSYELVMPYAVNYLKNVFQLNVEEKLFLEYAKLTGKFNAEEDNSQLDKKSIAKKLNVEEEVLRRMLDPLFACYAIADHTQTLLFTVSDGMLPSNSGGGYNLRMLLRRCFGFEHEFQVEIDYYKLMKEHVKTLKTLFPSLTFLDETVADLIYEEKKKFNKTKEVGRNKLVQILKTKKNIGIEELKVLYQSYGIPAEIVQEEANKLNISDIKVPQNFYSIIKEKEEVKEVSKRTLQKDYPKTVQMCYDDVYEHTATVIGIENELIILDKSAFYPEGGGQVGDTGFINDVEIIDTKKENGIIYHVAKNKEQARTLKINQHVLVKINKERRLRIMKNHTGAHLLHAAAVRVLGQHVWQYGAHKDENKAHLDLTHYKKITQEELKKIEYLVNTWIVQNLKVTKTVMKRNEAEEKYGMTLYQGGYIPGKELRIVKIESIDEIDVEACGGTHVNSTGEIGFFKIIRRETVQDNLERIVFACGIAALEFAQKQEALLKESATVFSVEDERLPITCNRFFNEWKQKDKQIELLLDYVTQKIEQENNKSVFEFRDFDKELLQKIAGKLIKKDVTCILTNNKIYFAVDKDNKAESILHQLLKTKKLDITLIKGKGKIAYFEHI